MNITTTRLGKSVATISGAIALALVGAGASAVLIPAASVSAAPIIAAPVPGPATPAPPALQAPAGRHTHGAHHGNMTVRVSNTRPCVIINRGGADLTVTTTGVRNSGLIGVTDYLVQPNGTETSKTAPHNNGVNGWQWSTHLAWNVKYGTWSAYSSAVYANGGNTTTKYANSRDFCVQEYSWFGTVHLSDYAPTAGKHITAAGGFYIHRSTTTNGYKPGALRWVKLWHRSTSGVWTYLGTDQTDTAGVWRKAFVNPGPGELYLSYTGSTEAAGTRSNGVLLSNTVN